MSKCLSTKVGQVHIFYSKEVADIAKEFPVEAWVASSHIRPLLENALEQWVQWTAEKLMPSGKEHHVSDRAAADILEWARALGDTLSRVAPLLDSTLMARLIGPFLADGDAALAVLARFTDRLVCRHVFDATTVTPGTLKLLDTCLDRLVDDRAFQRGWRAGEMHGYDLPQMVDALLFVNVELAPGAARFANGDWSQIVLVLPLVTKLVEKIGWATAVASRFLTLCERAGTAYPVAILPIKPMQCFVLWLHDNIGLAHCYPLACVRRTTSCGSQLSPHARCGAAASYCA